MKFHTPLILTFACLISSAPQSFSQTAFGPVHGVVQGTLTSAPRRSNVFTSTNISHVISNDGEAIFSTDMALEANDTVPGPHNNWPGFSNFEDIYARNLLASTTELLSTTAAGVGGNGNSTGVRASIDGRFVVFSTEATDIVPPDTNGFSDIIWLDRQSGLKERISMGLNGVEPNGPSLLPDVSDDGRFVVYYSDATNLVANDTNGYRDAFFFDRVTGVTTRVGTGPLVAQPNGFSTFFPRISGDGSYVIWITNAPNLTLIYTLPTSSVVGWDPLTGTTELISIPPPGFTVTQSAHADISGDGQVIAYQSSFPGAHVYDRSTGVRTTYPTSGERIQISNDGRYLVSSGSSSHPLTTSGAGSKVYRYDRVSGDLQVICINEAGEVSNLPSFLPSLSDNGRYAIYGTRATNIVPEELPPGQLQPFIFNPMLIAIDLGPGESLAPGTLGALTAPPRTVLVEGTGPTSSALSLNYTLPNMPCILAVKVAPAGLPSLQYGGEVYPWPPDFLLSFMTPDALTGYSVAAPLILPIAWHPATPSGTQVQAQWASLDPASPYGITLSNAYLVARP